MSRYEQLLTENEHIKIRDTHSLPDGYSGFYNDGIIFIDKNLPKHEKLKCYTKNLHIINLHMGTSRWSLNGLTNLKATQDVMDTRPHCLAYYCRGTSLRCK